MSGVRTIILGAVAMIALMGGIAPAIADQGERGGFTNSPSHESDNSYVKKSYNQSLKNQGNSNDRNNSRTHTVRIYDNDRTALRRYAENTYKKYCPTSATKKRGECLQYGQKQKRYLVGYPLPDKILYYPVPRDVVKPLRPVPTGYQYVRVDNDVLLMESSTRQIIEAVVVLASAKK